jgi:imidazolonepropionase-like amidohydrolase
MNTNVLIEDNLIAAVGPAITLPEGTEGIDGGGRTLMSGIIYDISFTTYGYDGNDRSL